MKKLFAIMLALVMVLAAVPVLAEGKGDPSKQLTVSNDGEYKTVQAAIDYIKVQSDKSDWTITVKNGTYARFTVPSGLDGLTIEGESQSGVLEISGNTISGTDALRAKVIAQQKDPNTMKVKVSGNCMENAVIGLVNLSGEGEKLSDPLTDNTLGKNCFYVEAIEPGTIDFYSAYYAPGGDNGYWELTDIEDIDVDWGNNPENSKAFIQKLVDEANAKGSHTLSITGIDENNLIKTFTWFKDAIYWNSQEPEPTPTPDPWYPPYNPTPVQPVQPVQPAPLPPQTGDMPLWYAVAQFLGLVK